MLLDAAQHTGMKKTLALLCGGLSAEDYLSRRSCGLVYSELDHSKFDILVLDWQKDGSVVESKINNPDQLHASHRSILECFTRFRGDVVVNLIHGEKENCGELQGLLDLAGIPYTGNNLCSSVVGMVKCLSKQVFKELGIKTPRDFLFHPAGKNEWLRLLDRFRQESLQFPIILKPVKGGSSLGVHLAHNEAELFDFLETDFNGNAYIFEEFIQGDDYCVGVFATTSSSAPIIFPTARIAHEGEFFDARIKYEDTYRVEFPADIPVELSRAMQDAAVRTHEYIGFNGFSRCDFIVGGNDFYALEVNTHPGMSPFSIVPNMVRQAQLSLGMLFEQMIKEALDGSGEKKAEQWAEEATMVI